MIQGSEVKYDHIWTLIYIVFSVTAAEHLLRNAPQIWKWLIFVFGLGPGQGQEPKQIKGQEPKQIKEAEAEEPDHTYSVSLVRKYSENEKMQQQNEMVEKVDAVIEYLSNLDSTLHVHLDGRYIIDKDCDLPVTTNLRAAIKHIRHANGTTSLEILLYSNELRISAIRAWIDQIHEEYIYEKSNRLGHKTYYFNEIAIEPPRDTTFLRDEKTAAANEIRYRFDNANPSLHFTMNEFHTSKSFSNVYGSHVDELRERLAIFTDHPEWYVERGIPHTLGILLHGIPGAGKTSTIKAIANDTGRHIFNLALRPYTTCKQLTNLFYNESVTVVGSDGAEHIYRIPLNKRIYVIEDIDCLTDVVLDRSSVTTSTETKIAPHNEVLTLSFLLNLLDGVLETPGRILVITSNYPERIDKALIRPGRIDVKVEFNRADRQFIKDMMSHFYDIEVVLEDIPEALNGVFTPAEVMESLCMYFKDPDGALMALRARASTSAHNGSSTTLEELMGLPAPTPSEVIAEYASCPWTEFRLKAQAKSAQIKVAEIPAENRLLEAILKAGSNVKEEDLIQYVEEGSDGEKLEKVRLALKMFEEEATNSRQILSHEVIENPDAANFAEAEGLTSCIEPMEPFNTDPSIEEHFRELFTELSRSKGSVASNYTKMNTILRRSAAPMTDEENDLVNRILKEINEPLPDEESSSSGEWIHPSDRSESSDSE